MLIQQTLLLCLPLENHLSFTVLSNTDNAPNEIFNIFSWKSDEKLLKTIFREKIGKKVAAKKPSRQSKNRPEQPSKLMKKAPKQIDSEFVFEGPDVHYSF